MWNAGGENFRQKSIVDPGEVAKALHRAGDSAVAKGYGGQASINLLGKCGDI
ncbi:MAG: hypothetical protein KJ757_05385 [Planctomycetes bacterium]|nr:hypothetical protein [Planctomycetota bacterium]MBU1518832.1 hypothetical protein [Planctomycetota bacterium]MBU2458268.1 hypothetical protein [Planctomycetota bacterium]MBU2596971.1 hypothetical protein [Planctomycetota bacterium]